jgi:hypothetical protein
LWVLLKVEKKVAEKVSRLAGVMANKKAPLLAYQMVALSVEKLVTKLAAQLDSKKEIGMEYR